MGDERKPGTGAITWRDLTVPNAEAVKDFYVKVVGYTVSEYDHGDYVDYNLHRPDTGEIVAGVCHARGANAKLPPMWLNYMSVDDADVAAAQVKALGGEIIDGPKSMGNDRYVIVKDPAGAAVALYAKGDKAKAD